MKGSRPKKLRDFLKNKMFSLSYPTSCLAKDYIFLFFLLGKQLLVQNLVSVIQFSHTAPKRLVFKKKL